MNYIDSHVHVWTDNFDHYPLAPGVGVDDMEIRRFLPEHILAHAKASGVTRVALVQMSYYQTDNRYMLDVIKAAPETFRGIAIVDSSSPGLAQQMQSLKSQGVRGFRIVILDKSAASRLAAGHFNKMFRYAAQQELAVCPLINPDFLPQLSATCERHPETRVCVDHLGRIGAVGPIREEEVASLCALAKYPEVRVKVSAFYALGQKRAPHLDLAPFIRRVYDAFGPKRLMWASDCPFQILNEPYEDSIALVRDRLDFLSPEDREWILRGTAEAVFFS